jgi:hypothetical protein
MTVLTSAPFEIQLDLVSSAWQFLNRVSHPDKILCKDNYHHLMVITPAVMANKKTYPKRKILNGGFKRAYCGWYL